MQRRRRRSTKWFEESSGSTDAFVHRDLIKHEYLPRYDAQWHAFGWNLGAFVL